ncbi:head-tail adaptor protein [Salmonella enterica subsp. enterica serovar Kokomlemle]
MQVGKLRDRIRLLALTGERDALGEPLDTVNEVAAVFADVRVVSGREMIRSGVDINQQIFTIRIRARKVLPQWRIEVLSGPNRGVMLSISSVQPDPACKDTIITAATYER